MRARSPANREWWLFWPTPAKANRRSLHILPSEGFACLADDVCLIDATQPAAMVIPTAPWLKLWRNSLENLGREAEGLDRVFSDDDKYRLPLAPVFEPEPILKLVFLEGNEVSPTTTEIEEVPRVEAVPLLMNLTHHSYLLEATGQREENFLPLRPSVIPGQGLSPDPSLGSDASGVDGGCARESLARRVIRSHEQNRAERAWLMGKCSGQ